MNNVRKVDSLEKLKPFLNENGVLEVVRRNKKKRFTRFINIAIDDTQSEQSELVEKAIHHVAEMARGNHDQLETVARGVQLLSNIGYANLMLNAVNLSATCVGFAIIYKEMKQMGAEINRQLMQLDETVRKSFDIEHKFRFNEVLSDHNEMLDSIKRQKPYTEKEMRRLVDSEYRMIELLLDTLEANVSSDQGSLIVLLFMLMGMFTISLCRFDELYYYNNPQIRQHSNPWHTSHDIWMGAYDAMLSEWFTERLQDYYVLELGLRTWEADMLYLTMLAEVVDAREDVEDNQALIVAFGSRGALNRYRELAKKDVAETIRRAYQEAGDGMDAAEVEQVCEETLQMAGLV